jgi:hypothetical protein
MKKTYGVLLGAMLVAGCQTSYTATEKYLNRYAGAEAVAVNCPAYGGYGSVATMRADADKNLAQARALGATDADIQKARQRVNGNLTAAIFMVGPPQACSSFVNQLAWAGTSKAVSDPKRIPKKKP